MATGSVAITAGSGTPIRVVTNSGVDAGADQQVFTQADQYGNLQPSIADGTPSVDTGATGLLIDPFDAGLGNWTTAGTVAPTSTAGSASFPVSTTVSATSYMGSVATFQLQANTFLQVTALVTLEAAAITNNTRWWGYGANAATPTAAAPITNGVVFVVDYVAGVLYGAVYSAGTRTQTLTITRPTDGALHRYQILFKQSRVYFLLDGVSQGSIVSPNMAVTSGMQLIAGSANFTSAPASAPTLTLSSISMADPGKNSNQISDGLLPWRKATVRAASTSAAVTDTPLVVALHPLSPAYLPPSTLVASASAAAAAGTATLPAAGAGLFHYITNIRIERTTTAATTGAASSFVTGGANHALIFQLPSDTQAIGYQSTPVDYRPVTPLRVTAANTATTVTTPAVTATTYRITVTYYTGT